jgi:hypothetical protein
MTRFDYDRQAWVKDGRYVRCGHPDPCNCYGKAHEGETAPDGKCYVDGDHDGRCDDGCITSNES